MAKSLNHFKNYKIEYDDEFFDKVIKYYGGGDYDYTYSSIVDISKVLGLYDIVIPELDTYNRKMAKDILRRTNK